MPIKMAGQGALYNEKELQLKSNNLCSGEINEFLVGLRRICSWGKLLSAPHLSRQTTTEGEKKLVAQAPGWSMQRQWCA